MVSKMQSLYSPISSSPVRSQQWNRSRGRNIPWLGLLAWLGAILASIGTVVVLTTSHLKPTAEWPSKSIPVQPTVLLAILTALAPTSLRFDLSEGATIAWWTAALGSGTMNHLHQVWRQGVSVQAAAFSGRHSTLLSLACILSTAVVIDGLLLQRASRVELTTIHRSWTWIRTSSLTTYHNSSPRIRATPTSSTPRLL